MTHRCDSDRAGVSVHAEAGIIRAGIKMLSTYGKIPDPWASLPDRGVIKKWRSMGRPWLDPIIQATEDIYQIGTNKDVPKGVQNFWMRMCAISERRALSKEQKLLEIDETILEYMRNIS
jgi:hypothetical protein